jgi:hypothetical protein
LSLTLKPRPSHRVLALRILTIFIGCSGLFWATANLARSKASDNFWDIESHILGFETFTQASTLATLKSTTVQALSACDSHAQRALMLMEIPLADAALRSGAVQEFDQRTRAIEARARQSLACAPRDSFMWLLLFGMETEHGILNEHSFDLLAMSYDTAPNEAWIALRRIVVALPVIRNAPEPIQQKVLDEFQKLIVTGFLEMPARSYLSAPPSTRLLLQSRIDQLDQRSQRNFLEAVQKAGS